MTQLQVSLLESLDESPLRRFDLLIAKVLNLVLPGIQQEGIDSLD